MIVFAWVEQGRVYIEGSFGGKNKVHHGKIQVMDAQNQIVFEGTTDDKGYLSFPVPQNVKSDLTVLLDAGTAHKAKWVIQKTELITDTEVSGNTQRPGRVLWQGSGDVSGVPL